MYAHDTNTCICIMCTVVGIAQIPNPIIPIDSHQWHQCLEWLERGLLAELHEQYLIKTHNSIFLCVKKRNYICDFYSVIYNFCVGITKKTTLTFLMMALFLLQVVTDLVEVYSNKTNFIEKIMMN